MQNCTQMLTKLTTFPSMRIHVTRDLYLFKDKATLEL